MQLRYKHVSEVVYTALGKALENIGVELEGNEGSIAAKGIEGTYQYDQSAEMLDITIEKTPLLVPKSFIADKIDKVIEENGGERQEEIA